MEDKITLEVEKRILEDLFRLGNMDLPGFVSDEVLTNLIKTIKSKISTPAGVASAQPVQQNEYLQGGIKDDKPRNSNVLIVDDLGIITYQLEMLFKKLGFEVTISQEINDAIDKFKKQDFGYAIIDLFIPTEREGLILLDELKKLSLLCKLNTRIVVMTASAKPEYQTKCINRGADAFIEKTPGWQKKVIEACNLG